MKLTLPKAKIPKFLRYILYLTLLIEVVYFLSTALFINNKFIFNKILSLDGPDIKIGIQYGWSIFPGHVSLRGLTVEGEDPNVRWTIHLPKTALQIQLSDLFKKCLHVGKLIGSDLDFKLHLKTPEEKKEWPEDKKFLSLEEKKKQRWKLQFDDILLKKIANLQVANLSYQGQSQIQGTFFLWPGVEVEVGPAHLDLQSGTVTDKNPDKNNLQLMENISGSFKVQLTKFQPTDTSGSETFKYLNLNGKMQAEVKNFKVINFYLKSIPQVHVEGGKGALAAVFFINHGKVQPESSFQLKSTDIEMNAYGVTTKGEGIISGTVSKHNLDPLSEVKFFISKFELLSTLRKEVMMTGDEFQVVAQTQGLDLAEPFTEVDVTLKIPHAEVTDITQWTQVLKLPTKNVHVDKSHGKISALIFASSNKVKISKQQLKDGYLRFDFPALQGKWKKAEFKGNLTGNLTLKEVDLKNSIGQISKGSVSLNQVNWRFFNNNKKLAVKDWWLRGNLSDITTHFSKSLELSGAVSLDIKNSVPLLNLYRQIKELSGLKYYLLKPSSLKFFADFETAPERITFNKLRMNSDSFRADGNLTLLSSGHGV